MTLLKSHSLILVLVITWLFSFTLVSAQTPLESTSSGDSDSNGASSDISSDEDWYESEMITGDVEVGDFVVGPGRAELEIAPGETVVTYISVTNRISDDRTFKLEVEDITGSQDGSTSVSLTGDEPGPYSLRDYISFPEDTFTLDLGERAQIPITISLPPDAEPGGLYGSVLVSTVRDSNSANNAPQSPVIARVGSLFFITVEGDITRSGQTLSIDTVEDKLWYEEGPISLAILSENTGSVHLNPYGELSVTNIFGEEVGYVELEPWFVLPQSLRTREVAWDRELLFGRYTATAQINRGYDNIVDTVSVSFWVLPWKILLGVFGGVFVLLFTLRFIVKNFEFRRKT